MFDCPGSVKSRGGNGNNAETRLIARLPSLAFLKLPAIAS